MKISFDVDGTLLLVGQFVDRFQRFGDDVYIVTSRDGGKPNLDLLELASKLNIAHDKIHYTNNQLKLDKLEELGIEFHFDDDLDDVVEINRCSTTCKALAVNFKHTY